jgi:hypothetical protein
MTLIKQVLIVPVSFISLICLTFLIMTITIQDIDDIIILSLYIMIEKSNREGECLCVH